MFVPRRVSVLQSDTLEHVYFKCQPSSSLVRRLDSFEDKSLPILAQCPLAWQYFSASCYWKFPIRRSWHEARKECARFQADLVVIDSDKEFDFIAKNISDLREDFYVGFQYINGEREDRGDALLTRSFRFVVLDQPSCLVGLHVLLGRGSLRASFTDRASASFVRHFGSGASRSVVYERRCLRSKIEFYL